MSILLSLASTADVLMLQEIHGTRGDLETAMAQLPEFIAYSSHLGRATGGVAILIRHSLILDAAEVPDLVFDPGRCIMVFVPAIQTSFMCIHVTPAYPLEKKEKQ
jgi:exonuclease III